MEKEARVGNCWWIYDIDRCGRTVGDFCVVVGAIAFIPLEN